MTVIKPPRCSVISRPKPWRWPRAYGSDASTADLNERGAKIIIAQQLRRAKFPLDGELYKWRHLIENYFWKIKECKCIAMRVDKIGLNFSAMIYLAAAVINSR